MGYRVFDDDDLSSPHLLSSRQRQLLIDCRDSVAALNADLRAQVATLQARLAQSDSLLAQLNTEVAAFDDHSNSPAPGAPIALPSRFEPLAALQTPIAGSQPSRSASVQSSVRSQVDPPVALLAPVRIEPSPAPSSSSSGSSSSDIAMGETAPFAPVTTAPVAVGGARAQRAKSDESEDDSSESESEDESEED